MTQAIASPRPTAAPEDGHLPARRFVRHVYYVPGFFMGGPRFYRRTLVKEGERHAAAHGVAVEVSDDPELSADGLVPRFRLRARRPEGEVETRYALMRWEDIVLDYLAKPWSWRIAGGLATFFDYVLSGAYGRMFGLMRRFAIAWLFPFLYYPLALALVAVAGVLAYGLGRAAGWETGAFLIGLVVSGLALLAAGQLGRTAFFYLILNDFIFSRAIALDRAPELWTRLDAFADHVAVSLDRPDVDEVVVIGHSFGACLSPLVVERLAERHGDSLSRTPVTLMTLGGSLPLIGLHRRANRFRAALQRVSALPNVTWIDVSSSYDAMNFKRFDPIARFGLHDPARGTRSPQLIDTRFGKHQEGGFIAKWKLMRVHMQFIKSTDRREGYDYLRLITSAVPIPEALATVDR
jgi:hypothetical protein